MKLKKSILNIKEKNYLRDLLNREVEDLTRPYTDELYYIQEKLEFYPAKERMECEKCGRMFINTRRRKKAINSKGKKYEGIFLDNINYEKCSKTLSEFPVEKGDSVLLKCNNGTLIEMWNDKFSFDYTIKLYENPRKKEVKNVNQKLQKKSKK